MSTSKHFKSRANAIEVRGDDMNKAIKVLKKRLQEVGVFRELKDRTSFISKGEKKRRDQAKSKARRRKAEINAFARENNVSKDEARRILNGQKLSPR